MTADDLAPSVAMSSAGVVLNMYEGYNVFAKF